MKKSRLILTLLALTSTALLVHGNLTVSVSPDESIVVAAGSNRAFMKLDPATLEVKERVWNGMAINQMAFNQNGTVLLASDTGSGGLVTYYDAETLKKTGELRNMDFPCFVTACDRVAGIEGNRRDPAFLRIHSMTDQSEIQKIQITPRQAVAAVGLNAEGTMAGVIYAGQQDENEERLPADTDLRGLERVIDRQQKDGRTSVVEFYDVASGDLLARHTVFYVVSGVAQAIILNDKLMVIGYGNENAVIDQEGGVTMFQTENSFNYGMSFTTDHRFILSGGLADFSVTCTETLESKRTQIPERLPSWPEYFRGFDGRSDGLMLGTSCGFRIFQISPEAACVQFRPVF